VARAGRRVTAIEVKSGRRRGLAGLREFDAAFGPHRKLLVGEGGISLEDFLARPVEHWLRR
jgi:hypothetical protein